MTPTSGEATPVAGPTVLDAMRRHWLLVSLIVVACVDLALAYGALTRDEYRATATVSAPRPAGSALESDAQYLDSQVLLLKSRRVGDRALQIARATPAGAGIGRAELAPTIGDVEIKPPASGSSGYGTTIVDIEFTAPSAEEAQAGVNALAAAYDEVRSQEIADSAAARLAAIERSIATADSPNDVAALREERVQALIDQGRDLSQAASVSTAEKPEAPATPGPPALAATGLLLGILLGAIAAFARAVYLKHVGEAEVAHKVYGAPMLLERPAVDPARGGLELTEPDRLLGRVVAHRLRTVKDSAIVAVVATPENSGRSAVAAALALALAEDETPVLAADGGDGTMAELLRRGAPGQVGRHGPDGSSTTSLPLGSLSVLDLGGHETEWWDQRLTESHDRVVVVDCLSPSTSARGVDLLSRCHAAVVLVRAQDRVQDHVEVARWLEVTGVVVLGYAFTPYGRQGGRSWWPRRQPRVHEAEARSPRPVTASRADPVPETGRPVRYRRATSGLRRQVEERGA